MDKIEAMKLIQQQAIEMLEREDMSKWSQKHSLAAIDALREPIRLDAANGKPVGWIATGI